MAAMAFSRDLPPANGDQVLCKANMRRRVAQKQAAWMQQRAREMEAEAERAAGAAGARAERDEEATTAALAGGEQQRDHHQRRQQPQEQEGQQQNERQPRGQHGEGSTGAGADSLEAMRQRAAAAAQMRTDDDAAARAEEEPSTGEHAASAAGGLGMCAGDPDLKLLLDDGVEELLGVLQHLDADALDAL